MTVFFVKCEEKDRIARRVGLAAKAAYYGKRQPTPTKFTTKIVEGGIRIWRIK